MTTKVIFETALARALAVDALRLNLSQHTWDLIEKRVAAGIPAGVVADQVADAIADNPDITLSEAISRIVGLSDITTVG